MKNPNLGVLLRYYRKAAELSVNDVVAKFRNEYDTKLSNKTVYSWESGQNQPPADTLLTLCKMYNITNIMESLGYTDPVEEEEVEVVEEAEANTFVLTEREQELIEKYRSHEIFRTIVDKLSDLE